MTVEFVNEAIVRIDSDGDVHFTNAADVYFDARAMNFIQRLTRVMIIEQAAAE